MKMRMPWHEVPGDDGFQWSRNVTRMVCAGLLLFPLFFLACSLAIMATPGMPREEPALVAAFAVLALLITPVAPIVRERMAQTGIGLHLEGERPMGRRGRPVYATFSAATITGFMIAQAPALFGFLATALTRNLVPLFVGALVSYGMWAVMWPRRLLWARWTWQAKIGRDEETAP